MTSIGDNISKALITPLEQKEKTPYALLLEISVRSNMEIKCENKIYTFTNSNPIFETFIKFGNIESVFRARNKQNSKHGAASEILKKIEKDLKKNKKTFAAAQIIQDVTSNFFVRNENISEENLNSSFESAEDNTCVTVMQLNEILQKQGLKKLPEFKFDHGTGLPHNPTFTCHVELGLNKFSGTGKSKKAAKNQATLKLLNALKNEDEKSKSSSSPSISPEQSPNALIIEKPNNENKNNISSSSSDIETLYNNDYNSSRFFASTPIPSSNTDFHKVVEKIENINFNKDQSSHESLKTIKLSEFEPLRASYEDNSFQIFKNMNRPFIKKLLSQSLNYDYKTNYHMEVEFLKRELKFDVEYRNFKSNDPNMPDCNIGCIASISTNPSYIFIAYGKSIDDSILKVSYSIMLAIKTICNEM